MSGSRRRIGVLPPIAYPVLGLLFGGILVWAFSRILLAVSKEQAAGIALLMALNVLVGAALVAYGRRVRRRPASFPLLLSGGLVLVAAGVIALNLKPSTIEPAAPVQKVTLVAQGIKFVQTKLDFTAGEKVQVDFDNKDAQTGHNFVLFRGANASAPVVFRGTVITGPATTTYSFTAPPPGTYFFHCEVHPTLMTGTATVTPPAGGGPGGGALPLSAKNLLFSTKALTAPPGGQITIHFTNDDASVPHNVVVFNGKDATAPTLFRGPPVTGPGTADYTFPRPPPGTYFFHCEFHPTTMTGTLTVS
jgi:plastocyanin